LNSFPPGFCSCRMAGTTSPCRAGSPWRPAAVPENQFHLFNSGVLKKAQKFQGFTFLKTPKRVNAWKQQPPAVRLNSTHGVGGTIDRYHLERTIRHAQSPLPPPPLPMHFGQPPGIIAIRPPPCAAFSNRRRNLCTAALGVFTIQISGAAS